MGMVLHLAGIFSASLLTIFFQTSTVCFSLIDLGNELLNKASNPESSISSCSKNAGKVSTNLQCVNMLIVIARVHNIIVGRGWCYELLVIACILL